VLCTWTNEHVYLPGSEMNLTWLSCCCCLWLIVSPAKTAQPITMPFGMWTRVGPGKRVLDGCTLASPGEYCWTLHVRHVWFSVHVIRSCDSVLLWSTLCCGWRHIWSNYCNHFLAPRRRLCNHRLLATLCKKFQTDLHEIFSEGWQWASE